MPFLSLISQPGVAQFYDRDEIEDNELLKQIIPFSRRRSARIQI